MLICSSLFSGFDKNSHYYYSALTCCISSIQTCTEAPGGWGTKLRYLLQMGSDGEPSLGKTCLLLACSLEKCASKQHKKKLKREAKTHERRFFTTSSLILLSYTSESLINCDAPPLLRMQNSDGFRCVWLRCRRGGRRAPSVYPSRRRASALPHCASSIGRGDKAIRETEHLFHCCCYCCCCLQPVHSSLLVSHKTHTTASQHVWAFTYLVAQCRLILSCICLKASVHIWSMSYLPTIHRIVFSLSVGPNYGPREGSCSKLVGLESFTHTRMYVESLQPPCICAPDIKIIR